MKILVVLQNPWMKGRLKKGFHPSVWRREFLSSRSGKRLVRILGTDDFRVINANPTLTPTSNGSMLKPRSDAVARINRCRPDVVVVCGRLAADSVDARKLDPSIARHFMRHPAYRAFSREMERREAAAIRSAAATQRASAP